MIVDAAEDIGEVSLRIEFVALCRLDDGHRTGERFPPASEPANRKFFRPIAIDLMARSAGLLSIATRPSSTNRVKDARIRFSSRS